MLKVYNTLTGEKEEFEPLEPGKVKMYVCGLTVQNYSHMGHIRSAVNYDVMRRYLKYKGYDVKYVQNFTDINEKIVVRAEEEGLEPLELAEKYTRAYLEDIDKLNVEKADVYCTATENIEEIQQFVQSLIDKGYAYESKGNVYFSVEKFDDYGKLSGRNLEEMKAGSRIEVNQDKKHPMDFALWKKVAEDEIGWDSPWGKGWPGWHIECSAMSSKFLGSRFDIHGGGTDLIFPHHENEIAQSEACTGQKPFVKYWLHNGTVNLKGEKMSKSLGNFFTTRELLKKFNPDEVRYFLLTKHYHSPIDFSLEELENSRVSLNRLSNTRKSLINLLDKEQQKLDRTEKISDSTRNLKNVLENKEKDFEEAMDDDFNTAKAIGVFHELAREINSFINDPDFNLDQETWKVINKASLVFDKFTEILGLRMEIKQDISNQSELLNQLVEYILNLRQEARENKDWEFADKIRDDLQELGVSLKDTPQGVEWEIKEG